MNKYAVMAAVTVATVAVIFRVAQVRKVVVGN